MSQPRNVEGRVMIRDTLVDHSAPAHMHVPAGQGKLGGYHHIWARLARL
jgi:hypothetical protein